MAKARQFEKAGRWIAFHPTFECCGRSRATTASHQILGYPTLTEVESAKAHEHCILRLASDAKRKLSFGDAQTLQFYLRGKKLRVTAREL